MKKAVLVEVSILTRVIVDVDNEDVDLNSEDVTIKASKVVADKIRNGMEWNYVYENVVSIKSDEECPYDSRFD